MHLFCCAVLVLLIAVTGSRGCEYAVGWDQLVDSNVRLAAPPKIAPFQFPVRAKAGDKVSASCLVSGSSPLTIEWLKDGMPLSPNTARIVAEDDVSTIVFKSVGAAQTGNYTCVADNSFGSDRFSARLSVQCESVHRSDQSLTQT